MGLESWIKKKIVARGDLPALSKNLKKEGKEHCYHQWSL